MGGRRKGRGGKGVKASGLKNVVGKFTLHSAQAKRQPTSTAAPQPPRKRRTVKSAYQRPALASPSPVPPAGAASPAAVPLPKPASFGVSPALTASVPAAAAPVHASSVASVPVPAVADAAEAVEDLTHEEQLKALMAEASQEKLEVLLKFLDQSQAARVPQAGAPPSGGAALARNVAAVAAAAAAAVGAATVPAAVGAGTVPVQEEEEKKEKKRHYKMPWDLQKVFAMERMRLHGPRQNYGNGNMKQKKDI